jgi:hypothetical protein
MAAKRQHRDIGAPTMILAAITACLIVTGVGYYYLRPHHHRFGPPPVVTRNGRTIRAALPPFPTSVLRQIRRSAADLSASGGRTY